MKENTVVALNNFGELALARLTLHCHAVPHTLLMQKGLLEGGARNKPATADLLIYCELLHTSMDSPPWES